MPEGGIGGFFRAGTHVMPHKGSGGPLGRLGCKEVLVAQGAGAGACAVLVSI